MSSPENNESGSGTAPRSAENKRLTFWVKRFLDVAWYFSIGGLIVWPITILVVGLSIPDEPSQRHTDIHFILNFKVYPQAYEQMASEVSRPSELIQGVGEIKVNNTKSNFAWYLSGAITELMGVIGIFALYYLRKIFALLINGQEFHASNTEYIKKLGYVFIISSLIYPFLLYLGGQYILQDIGHHADTVVLSPALQFNWMGILIGLSLWVLAGVMTEATKIYEEQSLTI